MEKIVQFAKIMKSLIQMRPTISIIILE